MLNDPKQSNEIDYESPLKKSINVIKVGQDENPETIKWIMDN